MGRSMDAFGKDYIHLLVAISVISSKGGIPKIWGKTLLLLLLLGNRPVRCNGREKNHHFAQNV
jgi:hypothetical protein